MKHVQAGNLSVAQQQTQKAFEQVVAAINAPTPTVPPAAAPIPDAKAQAAGVAAQA
jgi:hypothetical protein